MNIKPFDYGMTVRCAYDNGSVLSLEIVGLTEKDVLSQFANGVRNLTALSLESGHATQLSVPHSIIGAFKNLAAIGLEVNYLFDQLKNASTGSATPAATTGGAVKAAQEEEAEEEEEADMDMGDMFGWF